MAPRATKKRDRVATSERLNPWLEALQRAMSRDAEQVPPDWIRRDEAFRLLGYKSYNGGKKQWLRMLRTGVVERRLFRINVGTKVMPVLHYRLAS
jgi:hypothetical protein